ncbi:intercellular adhesion molecule 1-like [Rhinoraja longicauda]
MVATLTTSGRHRHRHLHLVLLVFTLTTKGNGFEVVIETDTPSVEFGGSLNVTCRTTCSNYTMEIELKPGLNYSMINNNNSITYQFPTVEKWDLPIPCMVTCLSENDTLNDDKKVIIVYNRDLAIAPHPEVMEINKTYQLNCTGPRVYPNNKLNLTWRRGDKVVKWVGKDKVGKIPEEVPPLVNTLDIIASMTDNGKVYKCSAELDIDSNTTKTIESSAFTLQTYSFPEPPRILNGKPIEVNEEVTLECDVQNVFPAEKLNVTWFHNEEELKTVTKKLSSHHIQANTTWTPQDTGLTEFTCRADLDYPINLTRSHNISIEVYVFSEPVIQAPNKIVVGNPVNITCSVFNASGVLQLTLKNGNEILANESSSAELTIYHTVHPKAEMNGRHLTCVAELTLRHHSEPIVKQQITTLNVQSEESTRIIIGIVIIITAIIVAAIIITIIYQFVRAQKTGAYNVLNPTSSINNEIPRVNEPRDSFALQEAISNNNGNNSQTGLNNKSCITPGV